MTLPRMLATAALAVLTTTAAPAGPDDPPSTTGRSAHQPALCRNMPKPVVQLDFGSRYTDDSHDRSDLDAKGNAEVDRALKPVDDFIRDLSTLANQALESGVDGQPAAICVLEAIDHWASADALSRLDSTNAELAVPSRLAGIALAYGQATAALPGQDQARRARIEDWLIRRAEATRHFFDTEAPRNASRNNLRAWAGLAAAAVGTITGRQGLIDWAARTQELVTCQADDDGALPLEMARGSRALHYQLHATAALVVTAMLLDRAGGSTADLCNGALHRIVAFVPRAFAEPRLVSDKAGDRQTYLRGKEKLESSDLAWADAYLARFKAPELERLVKDFRPLTNSKLGGRVSLLWEGG